MSMLGRSKKIIDFIRDLESILTNPRQMFKIIFVERRGLSSAIGVLLFISLVKHWFL